jgi:preprotein translocase subunit SecE
VSFFEIYKRGQGRYLRIATFAAVETVGLGGSLALSAKLEAYAPIYIAYGLPVLLLGALTVFMFWMVNRPKSADFLIATEGEMKKVSWSSRKEIVGSTKVVIVATFILAAILYAVDVMFAVLSRKLGLMGG